MKLLSEEGRWVEDIWRSALSGFGGEQVYARSWHELSPILLEAPNGFYSEAVRPLSWWLRDATKSLKIDEEHTFWRIWDRLTSVAGSLELGNIDDPVSNAINAPVGILTESLLDRIWARRPKVGGGFDETIRPRITLLANGEEPSYVFCRVILASRLQVLFAIDQEWCSVNLLRYFDWDKSAEASRMWEGYLWVPKINPDLLAAIKKDMLKALAEKDHLGKHGLQICQLFAISSIEFPNGFTHKEMREALRKIDSEARAEIANTLWRRGVEAGKERASFWLNRAEPWIDSYWPKDRALNDGRSWRSF